MEFLSNVGVNALGDKLRASLSSGDRLSIISSYFTVFAFGELKDAIADMEPRRVLMLDRILSVPRMVGIHDGETA
ncbi:MAG: hypothetical protein IKF78_02125 [Atopobiaceae bacterium]|nr:hypothetical protein [Atopobiaceae bacterium]